MYNPLFLLLPLIALVSCGNRQHLPSLANDSTLQKIHQWKVQHNTPPLLDILSDENKHYRREAAFALATVGSGKAASSLESAFALEQSPDVQKALALALFHCGKTGTMTTTKLENLMAKSLNGQTTTHLLRTAGHIGDSSVWQWLVRFNTGNDSLLQEAQARGLYEMAYRGAYDPSSHEVMASVLENGGYTAQHWASYYFYRCYRKGEKAFKPVMKRLEKCYSNTKSINIKIKLSPCLQSAKGQELLAQSLEGEQDYRIKIAALQGLKKESAQAAHEAVRPLLQNQHPNLSYSAAMFFAQKGLPSQAKNYLKWAEAHTHWRTAIALKGASLLQGKDSIKVAAIMSLGRDLGSTNAPYRQMEAARVLAQQKGGFLPLYQYVAKGKNPMVKGVCLEGLAKLVIEHGDALNNAQVLGAFKPKTQILQWLISFSQSNDAHLAYVAAKYLRHEAFNAQNQVIQYTFLVKALEQWTLPQHYETQLELTKTLHFFQGKEYKDLRLDFNRTDSIDMTLLQQLSAQPLVKLQTNKGEITLKLLVDQAPQTATYLAQLVLDGFYNQKTFHRVVPNFVAQGGCPRGDGYGATDNALRTEVSFAEYQTGAVGVASAGKDTESCQFFISHMATPHLNGRYTIFAQVVEGMEVVHQLTIGDVIEKATWSPKTKEG